MDAKSVGLWIVALGVVTVFVGGAVYLGWLSWLGRLPGDLRIERPGFFLYFPLTSMILVSLVLSLFLSLLRKLF